MSDTFSYGIESGVFDYVRSDLGKAVTYVLNFLETKLQTDYSRYEAGRIIYTYVQMVQASKVAVFGGMNDPQAGAIAASLAKQSGVGTDLAYNILYALSDGASVGASGCASMLSGQSVSWLDDLQYKGVVGAISKAASDVIEGAAKALGIPTWLITVVVVVGAGVLIYFVVQKVRKA